MRSDINRKNPAHRDARLSLSSRKRSSRPVLDYGKIRGYLCVALLGLAANLSSANPIAITNVRIIDGNGGVPIEHGTVVVDGQRIVAIGASSEVHVPAGSRRIDGKGGSVLPGTRGHARASARRN